MCLYVCVHDLLTGIPATEVYLHPVFTISALQIILHECHGSDLSKLFAVYWKLTDKVVAVHTKKAYKSRGIAPLTHNLPNQMEWAISSHPNYLTPPTHMKNTTCW